MKRTSLFLSLLTAIMFAGCSNDDVIEEKTLPISSDGNAYLAVKIASVPDTRGTDEGFEYGTEDEHAVTSADFYFYDKDGAYVAKANVWNGGNPGGDDENIEFEGNSVVMLKGLTEKNFPKYVVTILNEPDNFEPGINLKAMEDRLIGSIKTGDNFIMTTTSYKHVDSENFAGTQPLYFATEVKAENFVKDPTGDPKAKPVVIYVERVAAKVKLGVDETKLTKVAGEDNTYEVRATVAGNPNTENGNDNIGAEVLRVRFDGWGLNATAKETHIVKNIDCTWTDNAFGTPAWNEPTNFRSLWGMGTAYDKDPDANGIYTNYLNYNKLSQMTATVGTGNLYCAENTNTAARLNNLAANATSVVIAATLLTNDGEGWGAHNMVRYSGLLYTEKAFKDYVLANLNTLGKLNYWQKELTSAEGEPEAYNYTQIGADAVEIVVVNEGDNSEVKLVVTDEAKAKTWVVRGGTPAGDQTTTLDSLDIALSAFVGNGFKGGKMYYNIPIEHLFNGVDADALEEGEYGVVRNHYYKLLVNKLEKVGTGVWNPGEGDYEYPIIPDSDPDYYQVGVQINILSWRVVSQDVEL